MLRMVVLLEVALDMPAASWRNFAAFRCHNCQTSSLLAFVLLFCVAPFLGTGLPLKSPCCTRHIAVWLRVGSNRLKPHSSNCAACGLPFLAAFNACRYASASGRQTILGTAEQIRREVIPVGFGFADGLEQLPPLFVGTFCAMG